MAWTLLGLCLGVSLVPSFQLVTTHAILRMETSSPSSGLETFGAGDVLFSNTPSSYTKSCGRSPGGVSTMLAQRSIAGTG